MSDTAKEQIAQINSKLNQMRELIEGPEWSQDIYNKVSELQKEIRTTLVAVTSNPTATEKDRQLARGKLLKEANNLNAAATKRLKQDASKKQRPDKGN
jgi:hypothetical protein